MAIVKNIIIHLKYNEYGESVIRGMKRVSKPGQRVYVNTKNLKPVLGGLGNGVVSTSRGIKTVKQCITEKSWRRIHLPSLVMESCNVQNW